MNDANKFDGVPVYWTIRQVADYLHQHPKTVERHIKTRLIPGFKLGGKWLVDRDKLVQQLKALQEKREK